MDALLQGGPSMRLNLGTGQGYSIREVIAAVERVCGRPVPFIEAPRRPGDPAALVAAPGHAEAVIGWIPRYSDLATIVETAWRWHARSPAEEEVDAALTR
jgi:UDP-glucose 4-epimerase